MSQMHLLERIEIMGMNRTLPSALLFLSLTLALSGTACVTQIPANSNAAITPPPQPSPPSSPAPAANPSTAASATPLTLPILDAFFASDEGFAKDLKTKLDLTDQQIERLRSAAREETSKLRETNPNGYTGTTEAARELAAKQVGEIIGEEKAAQVAALVRDRWRGTDGETTAKDVKTQPGAESESSAKPNAVPTDTRVVVNAPAYRMDVFENGRLLRSYKIGIGYPEFPLPTGLRKARAIIFNPSWTPPDEPWVESHSAKVKIGEKVEAGSALNPLGVLKIPIGSPSLIHGGKSPAKLGTFASHGCVGLTDALVQDFAKLLAQLAGVKLSDAAIAAYKKNRTETKQLNLRQPVPVELRYETIVAEDGKLHVYRDVYDRNTNTEDSLQTVLEANGLKLADLTEEERTKVLAAMNAMSAHPKRQVTSELANANAPPDTSSNHPANANDQKIKHQRGKKSVGGTQKEIVIEIAALKGKGYPASVLPTREGGRRK